MEIHLHAESCRCKKNCVFVDLEGARKAHKTCPKKKLFSLEKWAIWRSKKHVNDYFSVQMKKCPQS